MIYRFHGTDRPAQHISEVSGDAQVAHQAAAGSVLHLWNEKKANERSEAQERQRKGSLGTVEAQQVSCLLIRRHPYAATI